MGNDKNDAFGAFTAVRTLGAARDIVRERIRKMTKQQLARTIVVELAAGEHILPANEPLILDERDGDAQNKGKWPRGWCS